TLKGMIDEKGLSIEIEIDGGVNQQTAKQCVEAGATVLVAGSAIYNERDRKKAIAALKG
ncbi:MAG TPA: ribulose-phosphate 3-epimerase, partial [Pseudoneobacillus sp.]|nr:ribulose-phosphate 3-epimerase [Pseudoneobacillus sp.]